MKTATLVVGYIFFSKKSQLTSSQSDNGYLQVHAFILGLRQNLQHYENATAWAKTQATKLLSIYWLNIDWFSKILPPTRSSENLQGNVATRLRCGGIFNGSLIANFPTECASKSILKIDRCLAKIWTIKSLAACLFWLRVYNYHRVNCTVRNYRRPRCSVELQRLSLRRSSAPSKTLTVNTAERSRICRLLARTSYHSEYNSALKRHCCTRTGCCHSMFQHRDMNSLLEGCRPER